MDAGSAIDYAVDGGKRNACLLRHIHQRYFFNISAHAGQHAIKI
jgi:hypothetical protein